MWDGWTSKIKTRRRQGSEPWGHHREEYSRRRWESDPDLTQGQAGGRVATGESEGLQGDQAECGWTGGGGGDWETLGHVQDFGPTLWELGASGVFRKCCDLIYALKYGSRCCVESRCLGQGKKRDPQPGAVVLLSAITVRLGCGQPWVLGNFERRNRSLVLTDRM